MLLGRNSAKLSSLGFFFWTCWSEAISGVYSSNVGLFLCDALFYFIEFYLDRIAALVWMIDSDNGLGFLLRV